VQFYLAGLGSYRDVINAEAQGGYKSFTFTNNT